MGKTEIKINQKSISGGYHGKDKIFYVFFVGDSKPIYSGTLIMCQNYI
jgi:hypothetical protein